MKVNGIIEIDRTEIWTTCLQIPNLKNGSVIRIRSRYSKHTMRSLDIDRPARRAGSYTDTTNRINPESFL